MIVKIQDSPPGAATLKSREKTTAIESFNSIDADLGSNELSFRIGEIVWAFIDIPAFRNIDGDRDSPSASTTTPGNDGLLWPSIVLKHIPPQQNKASNSATDAEFRYHLCSLALNNRHEFTEQRLLPWLAYVPPIDINLPTYPNSVALNTESPPVDLSELPLKCVGPLFAQGMQLAHLILNRQDK